MGSLAGALSRSTFIGRVIDLSGLLVPLGMLFGQSGRFLKHSGRLAQQGTAVLCDLPRLILTPVCRR
jgi:hypothetical protein